MGRLSEYDDLERARLTSSVISDMRYMHIVNEAGSLLSELRILGASHEDLERDKKLLDGASPLTIGKIIHDLQAQIRALQRFNEAEGINPYCSNFWEE